jgi:hypothetical protein
MAAQRRDNLHLFFAGVGLFFETENSFMNLKWIILDGRIDLNSDDCKKIGICLKCYHLTNCWLTTEKL